MGHHRRRVTIAYNGVSLEVIVDEPAETTTTSLVMLPSSSPQLGGFRRDRRKFRDEGFLGAAPAATRHGWQ